MRRREVIAGLAGLWPFAALAQSGKTHLVLWLSTDSQPDPFIEGFREGMRDHGYVEGRNLTIVTRYAPGDPAAIGTMLPELRQIPADLIVTSGPAVRALRDATDKPVLFAVSGDPIALGLVRSLPRPGRNFTGSSFLSLELAQKRVEILRDILPNVRKVAILSNATHPGEEAEHKATQQAAAALSIVLAYVPFKAGREIGAALERVGTSGADAMLVYPDAVTMAHRAKIAAFTQAKRMPSMFGWREYCDAGGLASYGANQRETYVRLAAYGDRLLKGEKPADLPVEQPTKFEFVINIATANALGLSLPSRLIDRADVVIK